MAMKSYWHFVKPKTCQISSKILLSEKNIEFLSINLKNGKVYLKNTTKNDVVVTCLPAQPNTGGWCAGPGWGSSERRRVGCTMVEWSPEKANSKPVE